MNKNYTKVLYCVFKHTHYIRVYTRNMKLLTNFFKWFLKNKAMEKQQCTGSLPGKNFNLQFM